MVIRINTTGRPSAASPPDLPPLGTRRLLAVIDHAFQPYNIGDLLIYMTGTLVAAATR